MSDETSRGVLPAKLYFRIGEVAGLVGVEPHVLRYWEREFRSIRPSKSAKGQRVYSRRDVENLLRVRELLYGQGFTIAGAKKRMRDKEPLEALEPEDVSAAARPEPMGEPAVSAYTAPMALAPRAHVPSDAASARASAALESRVNLISPRAGGRPELPGSPGGHPQTPGSPGGHPQTPGSLGGHPQTPGSLGGHPQTPGPDRIRTQLEELKTEIEAFLEELGT